MHTKNGCKHGHRREIMAEAFVASHDMISAGVGKKWVTSFSILTYLQDCQSVPHIFRCTDTALDSYLV